MGDSMRVLKSFQGPAKSFGVPRIANMGQIRQVIRRQLAHQAPTLERTARELGLPVRTLQRRLHVIGASYTDVVDAVRFDLARRLLQEPNSRVSQVAKRLGYADPSSFSRAFRRWSGVPPKSFQSDRRSPSQPARGSSRDGGGAKWLESSEGHQ